MSLQLTDRTIALFCIEFGVGNVMGGVHRPEDDGKYILDYRFRYYRDDKTFDSDDAKNFYLAKIQCPNGEVELMSKMRKIYNDLVHFTGEVFHCEPKTWFIERGERTQEELMDLLLTMPGISAKKVMP